MMFCGLQEWYNMPMSSTQYVDSECVSSDPEKEA